MKAIRVSLITSSLIVVLLIAFGVYEYFILENARLIGGVAEVGVLFFVSVLLLVFFFVNGLIGFLPSVLSVFTGNTLKERVVPLVFSCVSILLCFAILLTQVMPVVDELSRG